MSPIIPPSRRTGSGRFRESDLLRRVFETVLQRCIGEGLVGGEAFAIDASLIKADANRQKGIEGAPLTLSRRISRVREGRAHAELGQQTDPRSPIGPTRSRRRAALRLLTAVDGDNGWHP